MDIKLNYREQGSGRPLLLLHGNGEDGSYFTHQLDHFSKRFRAIAVDTRGHGASPRGTKPFSIRQFADDLAGFMDEIGVRQADILGFSDGGNIAIAFALKYPERAGRLILNGANLDYAGMEIGVRIPIAIEYRIAKLLSPLSERMNARAEMLGLMVNDPSFSPDELCAIETPTLVIAGTNDMIKDGHTRLIARSIPNAELAIIEGSHFAARDNPAAFNDAVDAFLLQHPAESQ